MVIPAPYPIYFVPATDPPRIPGIYLCLVPIVVRVMV
jgi:hypothetical protein